MVETAPTTAPTPTISARYPVIDCDVHSVVPSVDALLPYLPAFWREQIAISAFKGPFEDPYPPHAPTTVRPDLRGANPAPAMSLAALQAQSLDPWGVEYAILNDAYGIESVHNPDAAMALASAVNDWHAAEWLAHEPRLRASILVATQQPEAAAREIERVGAHPGFVQVYLPVHSREPYGSRRYHPIWEAAVRHDLVVGIHFGGAPGTPPSGVGWPSTYVEGYTGAAQLFQSQLVSLISEGVFDRFPALRVTLIEGGWTWLPSFMWRFDKEWKGLRRETPWVRRPPSAYVREHVRFTAQPLDAPPDPDQFREIAAQCGAEELLLFSTDYPHWHFDTPDAAFPAGILSDAGTCRVMAANARAWYPRLQPIVER